MTDNQAMATIDLFCILIGSICIGIKFGLLVGIGVFLIAYAQLPSMAMRR